MPTEPIRVLCVFSTLDRGGAESMCMNLYRHIDRSKVQFDFVKHSSKRGVFEDEIESLGGHVYEAPRYRLYNQISYEAWWLKHLRDHPEHRIVHGHYFTISGVYFRVCKRMNRITVAHSHCTKAPEIVRKNEPSFLVKDYLARSINRYADVRLACSREAGFDLFGDVEFTVLNNAIETVKFKWDPYIANAVRKEFNLGQSFVLGNVSRFNLQKNPHGTLDIFLEIHYRRPDSKLLWVGDGPMKQEIEHRVDEACVRESVIFAGVREDIERMYQAMDAFIFPSYFEGLGMAAVESQAAGVPTLCSMAVPGEVNITNLCTLLPLDDLQRWVDILIELPANTVHPIMTKAIVDAGYDISKTARWIESKYIELNA